MTKRFHDNRRFAMSPVALGISRLFQSTSGRAVMAAALLAPWAALAGPQGGSVAAGQANIHQSSNKTTITQSSQRAVIDWRSFNVGSAESVAFVQPNASSATLNRVLGNDPSAIFGRITANGQVYLINPNGILFGRTAQVDVGGLVASTANISNANFMAGRLEFNEPGKAGAKVENQGTITVAEGGLAALVGRQVANSGVINARLGKVALASGDAFVLDLYGDQLVNLVVDSAAMDTLTDAAGRPLASQVDHSGRIVAEGGRVQLSASTAKQLVDGLINVSGVIRATSYDTSAPGLISLRGDRGTAVHVAGTLDASGIYGGRVEVTGSDVVLAGDARVLATGTQGGGTVAVGGNWQGRGALPNAKNLSIASGAVLDASAIEHGQGGTVSAWSDGVTSFDGSIFARGGAAGGDGGNVEVSGKGQLRFAGNVSAAAPRGRAGSLLLDPTNLFIDLAIEGGASITPPSTGDSYVRADTINQLLAAGTSVALQATNSITQNTGAQIDFRVGSNPLSGASL